MVYLTGMRIRSRITGALLAAGLLAGTGAAYGDQGEALRIGLLLNFSDAGDLDLRRAFDLAVEHLNAAGGVLGHPVESVMAEPTPDPAAAVAAARRLVEEEGAHVLVGPGTSATSIPVAEQVSGPGEIPTISPSATSPQLAAVADRDFLFRTALSDSAQGPILARVTRELGVDHAALIYHDDPWGRGLAAAFAAAWSGPLTAAALDPAPAAVLEALRRGKAAGAQALVVVAFEADGAAIVRQAVEHDLYDQFIFSDALKSLTVAQEIGVRHVAGQYGVAAASDPNSAASAAWEAAYRERYGALPVLAFVKEIYDAAIALGLAAQAAGSTSGAAIRDQLRAVGSAPGAVVTAGPEGVAAALRILAAGGAVDYDGAAATLDWDANGDLRRGHVGIWRFTADGRIEDLEAVPFDANVR